VNGYQFDLYVKISIVSSLVGLLLSLLLVIPFGVSGALVNAVTSRSFVFIIALCIVRKMKLVCLSKAYIWNKFDTAKAIQFFRFALMTLVAAFCAPVSQLIIRDYVITTFSIQAAGWWEGINQLSNMYLMIITSSFGVYYLPKLSELSNAVDIKREIKTAYKIIIPCLLIGLSCVYFARFFIIKVLFSPEFYEMSDLFFWRCIGDFFKIGSFLIAHLMLAKAMTKLYIITEIIFSGTYVIWAVVFGNLIGLQGLVFGYAVNYMVYFAVMYFCVYRRLK
jgi:PST family polysaccharide transporter